MSEIDRFSRLWDGTEPGWVLVKMNKQTIHLSLIFDEGGPTVQEIKAVRSTVPTFRALSATEAISQLRGATSLDIGEYESKEGRHIASSCEALKLRLIKHVYERSSYLLVNEITNAVSLIEDDNLNQRITEEALRRGVPVRHIEA